MILASVVDSAAQSAIFSEVVSRSAKSPWLGGTDAETEGDFVWADTADSLASTGFNNRKSKEPNGGTGSICLQMRNRDGLWQDDRYRHHVPVPVLAPPPSSLAHRSS